MKRRIGKETGFKATLSRRVGGRPRLRIPKRLPRAIRRMPSSPGFIAGSSQAKRAMAKARKARAKILRVRARGIPRKAVRKVVAPKRTPRRIPPTKEPRRAPPRRTPLRRTPPEKPPIKIKLKKIKRKIKRKPMVRGYVSTEKRKTIKKLNTIPLTKARALDILAHSLDRNPTIKGRTIKSLKKVRISILHRKLRSVPKGYFKRNRRKFVLRKLKRGRETFEMIEKKKFRKDSRRERIIRRRKKR